MFRGRRLFPLCSPLVHAAGISLASLMLIWQADQRVDRHRLVTLQIDDQSVRFSMPADEPATTRLHASLCNQYPPRSDTGVAVMRWIAETSRRYAEVTDQSDASEVETKDDAFHLVSHREDASESVWPQRWRRRVEQSEDWLDRYESSHQEMIKSQLSLAIAQSLQRRIWSPSQFACSALLAATIGLLAWIWMRLQPALPHDAVVTSEHERVPPTWYCIQQPIGVWMRRLFGVGLLTVTLLSFVV